jgi:hypothetical protein
MIERNEFRLGRTNLEWRVARLSMGGWKPIANTYASTSRESESFEDAFKAWRDDVRAHPRKKCVALVEDSLLRYSTVPGLNEARTLREYQEAARLRCETLFGWSPDTWTVKVALPPSNGPVLCCAYKTADFADWLAGCRSTGDTSPSILPEAVAAFNQFRTQLQDGLLAVISDSSCLAVVARNGSPTAVYQTSISTDQPWRDDDLDQWLESQSALMEPAIDIRRRQLIDARAWHSGFRLRQSLSYAA